MAHKSVSEWAQRVPSPLQSHAGEPALHREAAGRGEEGGEGRGESTRRRREGQGDREGAAGHWKVPEVDTGRHSLIFRVCTLPRWPASSGHHEVTWHERGTRCLRPSVRKQDGCAEACQSSPGSPTELGPGSVAVLVNGPSPPLEATLLPTPA